MGHFLDVGAFLNEARSTPKNGHCQFDPLLPKSATFGLMHCGKSTLRDHLVGTRGKCCASAISTRGAGGVPRRPRRGACAHHRVERTDRDARHEVRSTRSRATSSTKPPPTAAPREPARRQSAGRWRRPCREATAAVLRHGSPFRDHSCVCPAPGIGTQAAAARPTGLPIRILHLSPAAHLYLSPDDAVSRISASRSRAFGDLIVERESVCK